MLSRFARVSSISKKSSILYRVVSTSANNNNASQPAASDVRRYPHDAPERDMVNYPPMKIPEHSGKMRIGIVPDEWFQFMYNKTGVTGPYILFWGGLATVLSKEYFVPWVDTPEHLVFLGVVIGITKLYGKQLGEMLDKGAAARDKAFVDAIHDSTKEIDVQIKENELLKSLPEANKIIHAAKRENIHLQLESAFRQRMNQVYQEIKKRLDYQVALQNVHRRVEREQAVNYILDGVNRSIGAPQEKEAFQSGLSQLKQLSQKYAGTI